MSDLRKCYACETVYENTTHICEPHKMSSGKTICKHGSEPFDCRFCRTDENEMVLAITDCPIAVENLTIDQHYRFLQIIKAKDAEIQRLRAALEWYADGLYPGDESMVGNRLMNGRRAREALAGGKDE